MWKKSIIFVALLVSNLVAQHLEDTKGQGVLAQHADEVNKADLGDPILQWKINDILRDQGTSPRYSYSKILEKLEVDAKDGDPKKVYLLALMVGSDNLGIHKDLTRRKSLVAQASRLNYPQAMLEYARDIWEGERNADKALDLWWNAHEILVAQAEAGDQNAMSELWFFGPPNGLQQHQRAITFEKTSFQEGTRWLRRSADKEVVEAMFSLGLRMINRSINFGSTDEERGLAEREGREWLNKAAERGHWKAMVYLGHTYADCLRSEVRAAEKAGKPSPRNIVKAWYWWDKAIALVGEEKVMSILDPSGEAGVPQRPIN